MIGGAESIPFKQKTWHRVVGWVS